METLTRSLRKFRQKAKEMMLLKLKKKIAEVKFQCPELYLNPG